VLPLIFQQCKLKQEDFDKLKRDKSEANMLEKNKDVVRSTIRSKAASALEELSGI
jgi:hypothetical protein